MTVTCSEDVLEVRGATLPGSSAGPTAGGAGAAGAGVAASAVEPGVLPPALAERQPPFRLRASMNGITEAPGKVWFFELAAAVIDADRCVQCGACIAACPTDSLAVSDEGIPELVKMCTGCSLCWDFCPRGGLRYEATWLGPELGDGDDDAAHQADSGHPADAGGPLSGVPAVISGGVPRSGARAASAGVSPTQAGAVDVLPDPAPGLGATLGVHAARVRPDSRFRCESGQDGAVVSAILLAALEAGEIDAAVLAREDPERPWCGIPVVATSPAHIAKAAGSFYNQTMALAALDLDRAGLAHGARVALVGTPCEVQGIRAMQASNWRWGDWRVEAVVLTIALLCTKSFDYGKLMLDELAGRRGLDLAEVSKVDVIHGRMMVYGPGGGVLVDEPVRDFHGAALKGCDECADFLGRGADLSVGSVGSPEGYSSVIVRTAAGAKALERVAGELELCELSAPEALIKLDRLDKKVAAAALHRPLEPEGAMFIDFAEHLAAYDGSDRAPVWRGR